MHDITPTVLQKVRGKQRLVVSLRTSSMKNIVSNPKGYNVIGTIRRGMNMGLLAISPSGKFVRVNGWYVEMLEQPVVCAAICECMDLYLIKPALLEKVRENLRAPNVPKVVIRKRRSIISPKLDMV